MEILPQAMELVSRKVQTADLSNVRVIQGDALDTKLDDQSVDAELPYGVIPAPILPLDRRLPEVRRILKLDGVLAVWPASWMRRSIIKSVFFTISNRRSGMLNFKHSWELLYLRKKGSGFPSRYCPQIVPLMSDNTLLDSLF